MGVSGLLCADIDELGAAEAAEFSQTVASSGKCRIISASVDSTDAESVNAMIDLAKTQFGRIDYFVNSSGVCITSVSYVLHTNC